MKKFKLFIQDYIDVLIFIAAVSIKFFVYGRVIEEKYFSLTLILPGVLSSVIVIASFSLLLQKKARARLLYFMNIVLSSIILADIIYYSYYRDILCIPVIKNGVMLGAVKSSVTSLFKPYYFLFFIDIFVRPHHYFKRVREKDLKVRLCSFLMLLIIGASVNGYEVYKLNNDQPRLLTTMFNRIYIAKQIGSLDFHALDVYNTIAQTIHRNTYLSDTKKQEIKSFLTKNTTAQANPDLKGAAVGKNLIVIQVEALQQFVIGSKINGIEVTPNLNKFMKKSAYFDNYFYQVAAGNTSDAEFMTNNSIYPAPEGAVCYIYCGNQYASLPKALNAKGYTTAAMHGYKEDFWNRSVMNKTEGFDYFYGEKSYKIDDIVGMGISDKSFLNQSLDKIKSLKKPYFSFLITLSSHYPFDDVKHYGDLNVGEFDKSLLGNYLKSIHYADEQLGMFLDKLNDEGILKDTVVVLYGDHYAVPQQNEKSLYKFLGQNNGNELSWMELQKVPMMIHFPDDANAGVYNTSCGEMDLYPTLANLFNLPNKYTFGKDMFNAKNGHVVFRNGSFTDGNNFYLSQSNTFYYIKSGEKISVNSQLQAQKDEATKELEYSDAVLDHNLIKDFTSK